MTYQLQTAAAAETNLPADAVTTMDAGALSGLSSYSVSVETDAA